MKYMPFQEEGIGFITSRASAYLADKMGLGKTIQACGVINACPDVVRTLVICPASIKINWFRELETWCPLCVPGIASASDWPDTPTVIVNYDILHKYAGQLRRQVWDLIVLDEAHKLVTMDARRTKHVIGDGKHLRPILARRKLAMSGTPMTNRPRELFPMLHYLDPEAWPDFDQFGERYCGGVGKIVIQGFGFSAESRRENFRLWKQWCSAKGLNGKPSCTVPEFREFQDTCFPDRMKVREMPNYNGASNLLELRERILGKLMIRRKKEDVLTQLPPKTVQVVEVEVGRKLRALLNKESALWAKLGKTPEDLSKGFNRAILAQDDNVEATMEEISTIRRETAELKVPIIIDHLKDCIESSNKVVAFCHHKVVIEQVAEAFGDECVVVDGSVPQTKRQDRVDAFQQDLRVKLYLASEASAEGVTLTAAWHVVICEWFWSPGIMEQMVDRCHRIGSEKWQNVLAQYLFLADSMDARMAQTSVRKKLLEDTLLN